jgi:hypothetical protein
MGSLCFLLAVGVAFFVSDIWKLNLVAGLSRPLD